MTRISECPTFPGECGASGPDHKTIGGSDGNFEACACQRDVSGAIAENEISPAEHIQDARPAVHSTFYDVFALMQAQAGDRLNLSSLARTVTGNSASPPSILNRVSAKPAPIPPP